MKQPYQTLELTVRNQPGVLVRIAHIFARRSYNIHSLQVTAHENNEWSTITIVTSDVPNIELILLQLQKLIDVSTARVADQAYTSGD